jgi:hypothetical protein
MNCLHEKGQVVVLNCHGLVWMYVAKPDVEQWSWRGQVQEGV